VDLEGKKKFQVKKRC